MTPRRVLIVEDEALVRLHLETILAEMGCEVVGSAASGREAMASVAASPEPPDLVLMDIRISGDRDGIEVARELRDQHDLRCVFVTAYADRETVRRVQEVGALGYLVKPFNRAEVGAVLATAFGQKEILQRLRERSRSLESLLESTMEPVLVLDTAERVIALNEPAARLTGWTRAEAQDRSAAEVLRLDRTGEDVQTALRGVLDAAVDPTTPALALLAQDGRRYVVEVDVAPLQSPDGNRTGLFVVLHEPGVGRTTAAAGAARRVASVLDSPSLRASRFHEMVGSSAPMHRVFQQIRDLSAVDWTVVIEGETGSGKELVARALHASSARHSGPFVAVNCAGLTDSLLASQLFGHRRGAFTGAVRDQPGMFESANGGTLFLDEIGDVSMDVQRSLLRAVEEKRIQRLGDTRTQAVDVRLLVASQHDLAEEVRKGRFRADLLFRLRVGRIKLPPLRERRDDIPLLANWFLQHSRKAAGKSVQGLGDEALRRFQEYPWPGNVRELRSAIDYAVLACRGETIAAADLPPEILEASSSGGPATAAHGTAGLPPAGEDGEQIDRALEQAHGNRTRAARLLGVSRATFYRRLAERRQPPTPP